MVWACTSRDVVLVGGEARSELYFYGLLCRVSLYIQPFVTFSFRVFLFFFWLCPFLKNRIICFRFVFRFLLFYSVLMKLECGFQKDTLSSFNLGLIRFGYRGTFFLSHAISL